MENLKIKESKQYIIKCSVLVFKIKTCLSFLKTININTFHRDSWNSTFPWYFFVCNGLIFLILHKKNQFRIFEWNIKQLVHPSCWLVYSSIQFYLEILVANLFINYLIIIILHLLIINVLSYCSLFFIIVFYFKKKVKKKQGSS